MERALFVSVLACALLWIGTACGRKSGPASVQQPATGKPTEKIGLEKSSVQSTRPTLDTSLQLEKPVFLLAGIKREGCFGRCPVYEARLYSDGRAVYIGVEYVDRIGQFEATAEREAISVLFDEARRIGYFSLPGQFPVDGRSIPDLPSTSTQLHFKGSVKEIVNNHDGPRDLRRFETLMDGFFESLDWRRIDSIRQ